METQSPSELGKHGEGPDPKDDVLVLLHSLRLEFQKWQTAQVTSRSVFIKGGQRPNSPLFMLSILIPPDVQPAVQL